MQGYILKVAKVRDEDCIVDILTPQNFIHAYRFFGARHSSITQGYKIDFELQNNINFLPRLSGVMHLGFSWLIRRDKMLFWQQFMRLLHDHLKVAGESKNSENYEILDSFYFDLIEQTAIKFEKQSAKRLIVEAYVKILDFEGRLHNDFFCFHCEGEITDQISLLRAFLPVHSSCVSQSGFEISKIRELFETKKTTNLNDDEVNSLYSVVLEGF